MSHAKTLRLLIFSCSISVLLSGCYSLGGHYQRVSLSSGYYSNQQHHSYLVVPYYRPDYPNHHKPQRKHQHRHKAKHPHYVKPQRPPMIKPRPHKPSYYGQVQPQKPSPVRRSGGIQRPQTRPTIADPRRLPPKLYKPKRGNQP